MKFTIILQNLQGLNGSIKVDIGKNYYRPIIPRIEIVYFQEYKLRGNRLATLKDAI